MAQGYKARYDYVEVRVEKRGDAWSVTLRDVKHQEQIAHEDEFPNVADAKDAAIAFAVHHINIQHNDTLIYPYHISWQEY